MIDPDAAINSSSRICAACHSDNLSTARFCATCGAMLPSHNVSSPSSGAVMLMADARRHLNAAEWEEAALASEAVLAFDGSSAEAHNIIARARLKQGMRNAAIVHAERAAELEPDNVAYQADVALARGEGPGRNLAPAIAASAAALLIFITLVVVAATRPRNSLPSQDDVGLAPPGSVSGVPRAQGYPQTLPSPTGSAQPKLPPAPSVTAGPPVQRSGPAGETASVPPASPGPPQGTVEVSGLEPAPVDQALKAFPGPEPTPAKPKPAASTTPPASTRREVGAPATQPGGTAFGPGSNLTQGTTSAPPRQSPYVLNPPPVMSAEPDPGTTAAASPPPQQHFIDRNYPEAIRGYARIVQEDPDNGVAWQQLAAAYAQLGMRGEAAQAYRDAIAAYNRQVAAGGNADAAQRGIRTCERALQMLAVR
jgi:tetratricopeptide (TPR) repeat protein